MRIGADADSAAEAMLRREQEQTEEAVRAHNELVAYFRAQMLRLGREFITKAGRYRDAELVEALNQLANDLHRRDQLAEQIGRDGVSLDAVKRLVKGDPDKIVDVTVREAELDALRRLLVETDKDLGLA
jgi:hypothetical protein